MRDIEAGEEVITDYAMLDGDPNFRWEMKCSCEAENCRKFITSDDWKIPELQERYQGYFLPSMRVRIILLS